MILTPDQRLRVFVSSTLGELATERAAVRDAVHDLRLVPVMFELGARPHPPREVYRAYVEQSQIFIGVYGESYGWVAPGERVSGLEDELSMAEGLPRLVYVKEPAPERDPRLTELLATVGGDGRVGYRPFRDTAELRDLVKADLAMLLSERFETTAAPAPARAGLPVWRTALIGRADEVSALAALVTDDAVPLVCLVGPGGIGKTRLATAVAEQVASAFPDGVRYLDLSSVASVDLVGEAMARGLGVRTSSGVAAAVDVASTLHAKRLLLVVDNFEQLAEAAPVIGEILRAAPGVTALVTSRAPLRLAAERVYEVPALAPPVEADPAAAADSPAVRLFVEAARAAAPGFRLTPENAAAVVEIVRRLDGLPLAIVLAAARVRMLPPAALVDRLGDPLRLLTGGPRDLPDRQRTLRDTIAWSYRLLRPEDQEMFDRLGVFAGGWDLDAVAAVAAPGCDPLAALEALMEAALIRRDDAPGGQVRFTMLDTIRHYARTRLRERGQWRDARAAHAAHYAALAERGGRELDQVATGPAWLDRLELEHDNLNATLDWFHDQDEPVPALRLMWVTWTFWWRRGHIDEASRHLGAILDRSGALDQQSLGRALFFAGGAAFVSARFDTSEALLVRALPLLRTSGDRGSVALALGTLGQFAARRGDRERAARYLTESEELATGVGEAWQVSLVHSRLALLAVDEARFAEARAHARTALDVSGAAEEQLAAVVAHYTSAICAVTDGELGDARQHLVAGLSLAAAARDDAAAGTFLAAIADIDSCDGALERAVRLDAAAEAGRTPSNEMWMRAFVAPWPGRCFDRVTARDRLGAQAYDRARRDGGHLGLDRAIAEATAGR